MLVLNIINICWQLEMRPRIHYAGQGSVMLGHWWNNFIIVSDRFFISLYVMALPLFNWGPHLSYLCRLTKTTALLNLQTLGVWFCNRISYDNMPKLKLNVSNNNVEIFINAGYCVHTGWPEIDNHGRYSQVNGNVVLICACKTIGEDDVTVPVPPVHMMSQ